MNVPIHVLLGAIAGLTIFLGLPIARWRAVSDRMRSVLALSAAGVILFLLIEVGFQAMQRVEAAALSGAGVLVPGLLLVGGFAMGLVGLAWLEDYRRRRQTHGAGALEVATMVAIGIGFHNFAEGLVIGQSFSSGATSLGTVLVVGFALHNATEGFGIAGPLAGQGVSWPRLLSFGVIGGGPTAVGALVGGVWVNSSLELLFLALATGSLIYVTRELLRIRFADLSSTRAMVAVTVGVFLGFGTELVVDLGQAGLAASSAPATATVRFAGMAVEPALVSLTRGDGLEIRNDSDTTLVIEGNGLFVGEIAVLPGGSLTVGATGPAGAYRLTDERGLSGIAQVSLQPGNVSTDPLFEVGNALGALTVLEGHVRASKAVRDRGLRGDGPDPAADMARAPTHAGHPQNELLHGDEPDALALQDFLRQQGLLDALDAALTVFVADAGNTDVTPEEFDAAYQQTLATVERARQAIGGEAYDRPELRGAAVRFVLETAAGEYATAVQSGHITVEVPGAGGRDAFIEYQDARAFIHAARVLAEPLEADLPLDAVQALDILEQNVFRTLDPAVPNAPLPPTVVRSLLDTVIDALPE